MAPKVTAPEVRSRKRSRGAPTPRHAHRLRHPRGPHRRRRRGRHDPGRRLAGQQRAGPGRHPPGRRRGHGPPRGRRGPGRRPGPWWSGDLPWLSYHVSVEDTIRNAALLVRAGAEAVKLEGGRVRVAMIEALVATEIPVMGHLGLTPQSVHAMGGYKVQAKEAAAAEALVDRRQGHRRRGLLRHRPRGGPRRGGGPGHRRGRRAHHRDRGRGRPATGRSSSSTTCSAWAWAGCPSSSASYADLASVAVDVGLGLGRRRPVRGLPVRRRDLPPAPADRRRPGGP